MILAWSVRASATATSTRRCPILRPVDNRHRSDTAGRRNRRHLADHDGGSIASSERQDPQPEDFPQTTTLLEAAGFVNVEVTNTGDGYLEAYRATLAVAESGQLPHLGLHVLLGSGAKEKLGNSARNIEEGRTRPVRVICRKPD